MLLVLLKEINKIMCKILISYKEFIYKVLWSLPLKKDVVEKMWYSLPNLMF